MTGTHRECKLKETLRELEAELSAPRFIVKQAHNYPSMKEFALIDVLADVEFATVTISPHTLTVVDGNRRIAHTFTSSKHDTINLVETIGCDPLYWSFQMARHSNNADADECYEWDWESFQGAIHMQLHSWEKDLKDAPPEVSQELEPIKAACQEVLNCAPSLADVKLLERRWTHKEYDLFSLMPLDDYFIWDRKYLQALVVIKRVAETAGIPVNDPPED